MPPLAQPSSDGAKQRAQRVCLCLGFVLLSPLLLFLAWYLTDQSSWDSPRIRPRPGQDDDAAVFLTLPLTEAGETLRATLALCGPTCVPPAWLLALNSTGNVTKATLQARRFTAPSGLNCNALFSEEAGHLLDAPAPGSPPREIPADLLDAYTLGGRVPVVQHFMYSRYAGGSQKRFNWTTGMLEASVKVNLSGRHTGVYGSSAGANVWRALTGHVTPQTRALVIGSEVPWIEAMLLSLGAAQVTTLEYGRLVSDHPRMRPLLPQDFSAMYRAGSLGEFDVVVTYSSLEHSGMGRYGDALSPWGDVLAMARTRCVMKKGGRLLLGLPTEAPWDLIRYNAHRSYGLLRWPLMLQGFEVVEEVLYDRYRQALVSAVFQGL